MSGLLAQVDRKLARLKEQLGHVVRRGVLTLVADDYFVQVECYDGERYDDVELWQQFGFTSRPPTSGEVALVKAGGRGEGAIAVATTDRAHRPTGLSLGDAVHYAKATDSSQARAHAKADGDYDIHPGTGKTVNVGGTTTDCTDYLLKGTTFNSLFNTWLGALTTLLGLWQATLGASASVGGLQKLAAAWKVAADSPAPWTPNSADVKAFQEALELLANAPGGGIATFLTAHSTFVAAASSWLATKGKVA